MCIYAYDFVISCYNYHFTHRSPQRQPWARPAEPDQPIRAIQPAGRTRRPSTGCTRQTSDSIIA